MKDRFGKIIYINLGLLLVYSIIIHIIASITAGAGGGEGFIIGVSFYVILLHFALLFFSAIVLYVIGKDIASPIMLSAFITLLIGFAVCWGNASI